MEKLPMPNTCVSKFSEYGLSQVPLKVCQYLRFQPGETIVQAGTPIPWLAFIVKGRAKVCSSAPNGKNLVLSYYTSEGMIGDIEFISDLKLATATVIAITELECIMLPYYHHEKDLRANITFLNKLAEGLAKKTIHCSENYVAAALCSGEERLCAYILQTSHQNTFRDVLTDTACSVGMSYRHMFRLLGQLCEEGVLEKRASGYLILDRESLLRRVASSHHIQDERESFRQDHFLPHSHGVG